MSAEKVDKSLRDLGSPVLKSVKELLLGVSLAIALKYKSSVAEGKGLYTLPECR